MKAITIGGAMVDTIAIIESDRIERMSMLNAETSFLLLEEGRKTEALDVSTHCGGGAVNTAVAMARLGFDVQHWLSWGAMHAPISFSPGSLARAYPPAGCSAMPRPRPVRR